MLSVNELFRFKDIEGKDITERILWIDPGNIIVYTIDINSDEALPQTRKVVDIIKMLETGDMVRVIDDPWARLVDETQLGEKNRRLRDRAWGIIGPIVSEENEPAVYRRISRGPLIQQVMKEQGVTKRYVYKYLRRYWQRGKTKNALLSDYENSGARGEPRKASDKKLGRPRKHTHIQGEGVNVNEDIKRIFRTAANKFLLTEKENPLSIAYQLMIKEFFSETHCFENGVKKTILVPEEERPTPGQFRYWYEKEFNVKEVMVARKGPKKYLKDHRPILGTSDQEVVGPGSRFQIDATIADVYLVSRYNRNWIIGRPVIYVLIDVFSRMIAGLYIGLEGPSWLGAMMALANAAANKVGFCKEYGIDISSEQWPCAHLPEAILGDRGELEGKVVENLSSALNVRIENTAPYRADWKGIVERYFRTVHARVKPFLPGYVDTDFRQRGARDYRLDAKLDLYQFTQILIHCALHHNNNHYLTNYSRDEMMIDDDIPQVPIELWKWGISNRSGKLRSYPEDIVKLNLMPVDKVTVTPKGIKFKKMYYSCQRAVKEFWFDRARTEGTWKAYISYDPRNIDFVYIRDENGRGYEKCYLLESQERYRGKSYDEIVYLLEYEKQMQKTMHDKEMQDSVDLISQIESIVQTAEIMTTELQNRNQSKASRVKKIRTYRKEERERRREEEAFELDKGSLAPVAVRQKDKKAPVIPSPLGPMELLKRKQREKIHGKEE
ncbi:MAG: Mu transposase C-terminal domain-containing protein [Bacillota bacterium]